MLIRKPILMYHSTSDDPELRVNVTPQALESHLQHIASLGLKCLSVSEQMRAAPGSAIALSFDDGCISNLEIIELLQHYDAGATFFVLTGCSGETLECHQPKEVPIMDADGWWELHRNGFELAAHGVSHRKLSELDRDQCEYEMTESIAAVREVTGSREIGYAYPFGVMGRHGHELARRHAAYACCTRYLYPLAEDRWRLRRINIGPPDDSARLRKKLGAGFRLLCDLGY